MKPNQTCNLRTKKYFNRPNRLCRKTLKFWNITFSKCLSILKVISLNYNCENYLKKEWLNIMWDNIINISLWIQNINFNLILNIVKNHLNKNMKNIFEVLPERLYLNCSTKTKYFQILLHFYFHYFNLFIGSDILWKTKYKKIFNTKDASIQYNILILQNIWEKTVQNKTDIKYNFIQFSKKIWLQIILNLKQNKAIQEKIKNFSKKRLFSIRNVIKIYTSYNWNKFLLYFRLGISPTISCKINENLKPFLPENHVFLRKTKNQNYVVLKKCIQILSLHTAAKKYAKFRKNGKTIKATAYKILSMFDSQFIIKYFSDIIHKIIKYHLKYILCYNICFLIFIFRKTCALTLSNKHGIKTSTASFKKFEDLI